MYSLLTRLLIGFILYLHRSFRPQQQQLLHGNNNKTRVDKLIKLNLKVTQKTPLRQLKQTNKLTQIEPTTMQLLQQHRRADGNYSRVELSPLHSSNVGGGAGGRY